MEFVLVPLKLGVVSSGKGCSVVWDSQCGFAMGSSEWNQVLLPWVEFAWAAEWLRDTGPWIGGNPPHKIRGGMDTKRTSTFSLSKIGSKLRNVCLWWGFCPFWGYLSHYSTALTSSEISLVFNLNLFWQNSARSVLTCLQCILRQISFPSICIWRQFMCAQRLGAGLLLLAETIQPWSHATRWKISLTLCIN